MRNLLGRLTGRRSTGGEALERDDGEDGAGNAEWVVHSTPAYLSDGDQAELVRDPRFWAGFFSSTWGDEVDVVDAAFGVDSEAVIEFWNELSGWTEGILDESDGALERPKTLRLPFSDDRGLDIEIHAGGTYYRLRRGEDVEDLAALGPHDSTPGLPWSEIRRIAVLAEGGSDTRTAVPAPVALLLLAPLALPLPEDAPRDDIQGDLTAAIEDTGTVVRGQAAKLAAAWIETR